MENDLVPDYSYCPDERLGSVVGFDDRFVGQCMVHQGD